MAEDGLEKASAAVPTDEGRTKLLKRWPSLPLLSLGFWISWRFVLLSNTLPISVSEGSSVSFIAMFCVCLFAALRPEEFRAMMRKRSVAIAASVLAAIGTAFVLLGAFEASSLSGSARIACLYGGLVLSGVGMGSIALRSCEILGRLTPTEIWVWAAYTEFLVVGIYFAAAGSPVIVSSAMLVSLPLLAEFFLGFGDHPGSSLTLAREEREQIDVKNGIYVKFFLFVFLLSIASSFAKIVTLSGLADGEVASGIAWPALERIAIAVFIVFGVVYLSKRFPFSKMCTFVVIMIIVALGLVVLSSQENVMAFFATTLVHSVLECITITFSACLVFKTRCNPYAIIGFALAALGGGAIVCDAVSYVVSGWADGQSVVFIAFFVSAALSVVMALVFFQERSFDFLLGSVEDFFPQRGSLLQNASCGDGQDGATELLCRRLRDDWGLSPRECEVALKLKSGNTVTRIAENMNLSVHTVRGYIRVVYTKCDVHSRNELLDFLDEASR